MFRRPVEDKKVSIFRVKDAQIVYEKTIGMIEATREAVAMLCGMGQLNVVP